MHTIVFWSGNKQNSRSQSLLTWLPTCQSCTWHPHPTPIARLPPPSRHLKPISSGESMSYNFQASGAWKAKPHLSSMNLLLRKTAALTRGIQSLRKWLARTTTQQKHWMLAHLWKSRQRSRTPPPTKAPSCSIHLFLLKRMKNSSLLLLTTGPSWCDAIFALATSPSQNWSY